MAVTFLTKNGNFKLDKEGTETLRKECMAIQQLLPKGTKNVSQVEIRFCTNDEFSMLQKYFLHDDKTHFLLFHSDNGHTYLKLAKQFEAPKLMEWCTNEMNEAVRRGNLLLPRIFELFVTVKTFALRDVFPTLVIFLITDHMNDDEGDKIMDEAEESIGEGLKDAGLSLASTYVVLKCVADCRRKFQQRFRHDFTYTGTCRNAKCCCSKVLHCYKCNVTVCCKCGTKREEENTEVASDLHCFNCNRLMWACDCDFECVCATCHKKKTDCRQPFSLCDEMKVEDNVWNDFLEQSIN